MPRPAWRTRTIAANHGCRRPSQFVFVAVESQERKREKQRTYQEDVFKRGAYCAVDWRRGRRERVEQGKFDSPTDFWQCLSLLCRANGVVWVVAAGAQRTFTLLGLWSLLDNGSFRPSRLAIDGIPWQVEVNGDAGRVNFTDVQNYGDCPEALRGVLADRVSRTKERYLSLLHQWEDCNNGNWQFSTASLAWNHWRHRHYSTPIVQHQHAAARQLEWDSYYPGECRAFYRGSTGNPVGHYDVNSLFPSVMEGNQYPVELIDYVKAPSPKTFARITNRYGAIAHVQLKADTDTFPIRRDKRTLYPVGDFETVLAGAELARACATGAIRECEALAYYRTGRIFDSYVGEWYAKRKAAAISHDDKASQFAKMMLNSLYGKFAQRTPAWEIEPKCEVVQPWTTFPWKDSVTGTVHPARAVGWTAQVARLRRDCAHTFPAVAAFVTAAARERMRTLRSMLPPGSVLYQDTDSIFVDTASTNVHACLQSEIGDGLGQLRHVATYQRCEFRGQKNYTCDGRHVISGVKPGDIEIAPLLFAGAREEGAGPIVSREPDGAIRSWPSEYYLPGTCHEGGYSEDGWYFPIELA